MSVPTRVLQVDATRPESSVIAEAARVIARGGLVAFPTETVYGLGASALDEAAVRRIFEAKGRPAWNPLIVHVCSVQEARVLTTGWSDVAQRLAEAFWPGPLTLVLPRAACVPSIVAAGGSTVALRAPSHPVARALVAEAGPIAAPSANRYQSLSPTTAAHVLKTLDGRVDLLLDGGPCSDGIESTVVDVTRPVPVVLRPGSLSLESLRRVVGNIETVGGVARKDFAKDEARPSPGMVARHYAPKARLHIAPSREAAWALATSLLREGKRVAMVTVGNPFASGDDAPSQGVVLVGLGETPAQYAHELFATLHSLDGDGMTDIVVEAVPDTDEWWGVRDRLSRGSVAPTGE